MNATPSPETLPKIEKKKRIKGQDREKLGAELSKRYRKGASIRALAEATGRSYGFVRDLLEEMGVELRSHGGSVPTRFSANWSAERAALGPWLKKQYEKGATIPVLAKRIGMSESFVCKVLHEQGTAMRPGGPR